MTREGSPLRGRYLVVNPVGNALLRASDAVLGLFARDVPVAGGPPPRKFLIAVGGHLGDAMLATSVLGPIRSTWPSAEIGVVTGSWNSQVFAGHPEIRWLHVADQWKLDRSDRAWITRAVRASLSQRAALAEIRAKAYDVALDLYPYYPNASRLLKRAGISTRVGYVSGGGGPRYTHPIEWNPSGHVTAEHLRVLAALGISLANVIPGYRLSPRSIEAGANAKRKLEALGGVAAPYVVLHMGAGTPRKLWPVEHWAMVARAVLSGGLSVVLTGAGAADAKRTRDVKHQVPGVVDACDALTWDELRHVLAGARATISVDTSAAHLSAAEGTATVVVVTGGDDPARWRPLGEHVTVVSEQAAVQSVLAAMHARLGQ